MILTSREFEREPGNCRVHSRQLRELALSLQFTVNPELCGGWLLRKGIEFEPAPPEFLTCYEGARATTESTS